MARVPYFEPTDNPDLASAMAEVKKSRGRFSDLYRMLLNSPPVAEGWLHFLNAVRREAVLPGRYRELVIMHIAVLNGAPYEARGHRHHALDAGLTAAQLDALDGWEASALFSDVERAVLRYSDAMTRTVAVPDAVFAAVHQHFDDRQLVELTATIAAYNMVSRFLVALNVGE